MKRDFLPVFLLILLWLVPVYVRSFTEAKEKLEAAQSAEREGRTEDAMNDYARAVAWRIPGNTYAASAVQEFMRFADSLVLREAKLEALLRLRAALQSSRSFLNPTVPPELDNDIKKLDPDALTPKVIDRFEPQDAFFTQIVIQFLLWGWMLSGCAVIWRGFTKDGKRNVLEFRRYALFTALFYAGWALMLGWGSRFP